MYAVIRLRGNIKTRTSFRNILSMLGLKKINSCVLVPETDSYKGALQKTKDSITWGEVSNEIVLSLLKKRGFVKYKKSNDPKKKITQEFLNESGIKTFENLLELVLKGKSNEIGLCPFRFRPAKKGLKSTKLHFPKGDLGYRKDKINDLLKKMM